MSSFLRRGLVAGAAGTTVLNAVTYADMAVRGREASSTPERTVQALAGQAGISVPGDRQARQNRLTALGALLGSASGLAVAVGAAKVRALGVRFPAPVDAVLTAAAAMAVTDAPMAALGVSDPRQWTRADWISDAVPHLAYGAAVATALRTGADEPPVQRAGAGLMLRSAALGLATGSRSALGFAGPTLIGASAAAGSGPGRVARGTAAVAAATEVVMDKLPSTPDRTSAQALPARLAAAAAGATALARRRQANAALPVVFAVAGAAAGSFGGLAWRRWAGHRMPDWQAALIEDAVALTLAGAACRA